MKVLQYLKSSKTLIFSLLLSTFGILQANIAMLQDSLQEYYPYVFIGVGIISAWLRMVTTASVHEKVRQAQRK